MDLEDERVIAVQGLGGFRVGDHGELGDVRSRRLDRRVQGDPPQGVRSAPVRRGDFV